MPRNKSKSRDRSRGKKGKGKKSSAKVDVPEHPNGIFPMVLTSATQELFGCRADEDVTGENPYKLLKKEDIIQDIKTRAAVSDFSPVKQIVLDYPEEELLLVYDRDFTYDQSFYLDLTAEAKDKILNPPKPVLENEIPKTPEPKIWISLGSEQEIEDESVKERKKLVFKCILGRKIRTPVCFSDSKITHLECPSYPDSRFSIKKMQIDRGLQSIPRLQSSSTQTHWKPKRNNCTQYEPRELDEEEKERILQAESLKNFLELVTPRVLHALQQEEIMNVFVDDFKALATADEESNSSGQIFQDLKLHQIFADHKYIKDKKIRSINWHPTLDGVFAVAPITHPEKQSTARDIRPPLILFYTFLDPSTPQLLLESPDDILAFEFSPSDPNIIVGGTAKGQVVLWDISAHVAHLQGLKHDGRKMYENTGYFDLYGNTPFVPFCALSDIEYSHKAPITDVHWLPHTFEVTKMGLPVENKHDISVQFVSCSYDSFLLFWDIRSPKAASHSASGRKQNVQKPQTFKHLDHTWKPLFRVSLPKIDTSGEYVPMKFNLEHHTCDSKIGKNTGSRSKVIPDYSELTVPSAKTLTALDDVNTKLCIGTLDGEIVYTDWKLIKDDSGRLQSAKPFHCSRVHSSYVNTVQRSPFFKEIILTAGCFNFAIWKEGVMVGPILHLDISEQLCTAACWSLSRPAIFFIGKDDGSVEVWNLLIKTYGPTQVLAHVTSGKITCIKPWIASSKKHFLAVCDDHGEVRLFEIPRSLSIATKNEISNMQRNFQLEQDRMIQWVGMQKELKKEAEERKKKRDDEMLCSQKPDKPVKTPEEEEEESLREYLAELAEEQRLLELYGLLPATAKP